MLLFRHGLRRSLRPARTKVDLRLTTEAITQRLSDMTDAELAALEARMITISPTLALEHVYEPQVDGDTDAEHGNDGDGCVGRCRRASGRRRRGFRAGRPRLTGWPCSGFVRGAAASDGTAGYLAVELRCVTTAGGSGVHYRCRQQAAACYRTWDQGKPSPAATTAVQGTAQLGRIPRHCGDRRQCGRTKFDLRL